MHHPWQTPAWNLAALLLLGFILAGCQPPLSETSQQEILHQLISENDDAFTAALDKIAEANDPAFIPPLIDLLWAAQIGLVPDQHTPKIQQTLAQLTGQDAGPDWHTWASWLADASQRPPAGYLSWKGDLLAQLHPDFARFFAGPAASDFQVSEIVWGGVAKDGIPSLDYIEQVPISEAAGYTPKDAVFGISINGDHRAYPLRIMDWHEMANDVVGGVPIALTYCTLCGSAIVYATDSAAIATADLDTLFEFGSSGLLYRNNKLMYDRQTNTLWSQLTGRPVLGPLVGQEISLTIVPVVITTVEAWQAQHPDATILPLDTGFFRDYTAGAAYGEYFVGDTLLFPSGERDDRLPAKAQVFALEVGTAAKAYPLDALAGQTVINDAVGRTPVVLLANSTHINVYGYSYELEYITYSAGGEIRAYERGDYHFDLNTNGEVVDRDGAVWQVSEAYLLGPDGEQLMRLSGHISFWFGWHTFFPETALYLGDDG